MNDEEDALLLRFNHHPIASRRPLLARMSGEATSNHTHVKSVGYYVYLWNEKVMQDICPQELAFVSESETIVQPIIETTLKNEDYNGKRVAQWIDTICEKCMGELVDLGKPL